MQDYKIQMLPVLADESTRKVGVAVGEPVRRTAFTIREFSFLKSMDPNPVTGSQPEAA